MDYTALIDFLQSTGFVTVSCNNGLSPRGVDIALPLGLTLTMDYATYQQIREAAGLPDIVCD